jgi:hypothetical protein
MRATAKSLCRPRQIFKLFRCAERATAGGQAHSRSITVPILQAGCRAPWHNYSALGGGFPAPLAMQPATAAILNECNCLDIGASASSELGAMRSGSNPCIHVLTGGGLPTIMPGMRTHPGRQHRVRGRPRHSVAWPTMLDAKPREWRRSGETCKIVSKSRTSGGFG